MQQPPDQAAHPMWTLHGESRYWFEQRHNYNLGRSPDINTVLIRNRLLLEFRPNESFRFVGQFQDTRAPGWTRPRPGTSEDPHDLQEGYIEYRPDAKQGWNVIVGRKRFFFGGQYFIGVPEWVNSGRTYDTAQINYGWKAGMLRTLMVSQVRFNPSGFNVPVLRDRLTGVYFQGAKDYDLYFFRHDRINLPATHSLGARKQILRGPWRVTGEAVAQGNAFGSVAEVYRKVGPVIVGADYEFASPEFDQLYPAAHNRLGHGDVMLFRNVHSLQAHLRVPATKRGVVNLMYTANLLVDKARPAIWFGGTPIPVPPGGNTERMAGQEIAIYSGHAWKHFQLGLGLAQWFNGEPLKYAAPGRSLRYAYVHTGVYF